MSRSAFFCLAAGVVALAGSSDRAAGAAGELAGLARLSDARTRRVSSAAENLQSNSDARRIAPGETLTLGELRGPGAITHLWFTINAEDPYYPRSLVLRAYWDGAEEPAIEAPIGDFFAVGHGASVPVDSIPVQVSSEGRARNCFWRMPFRESARLTVSNDSAEHAVRSFYYYIDYEELPSLPGDTPYFHAQYRQEYPCQPGDYLILDAEGRGHLVGTVLSVWHTRGGWFGEGDDRFYIDGDPLPTLHGTGTEDYFSDAWGFRPFNQPFHGVTLWDERGIASRGTAYRWHIADPVRFDKSLVFTIEHTGPILDLSGKRLQNYGERSDCFSSVAFWYQTGRAKRFARMPPVEERMPKRLFYGARRILDEALARAEAIGAVSFQGGAGGGGRVWFQPADDPDTPWLEIEFETPEASVYAIEGRLSHSWDYGDYRVSLDGRPVEARASFYSPTLESVSHSWGAHALAQGRHTLRFEYLGSDPRSRNKANGKVGRLMGLESIELFAIPD